MKVFETVAIVLFIAGVLFWVCMIWMSDIRLQLLLTGAVCLGLAVLIGGDE